MLSRCQQRLIAACGRRRQSAQHRSRPSALLAVPSALAVHVNCFSDRATMGVPRPAYPSSCRGLSSRRPPAPVAHSIQALLPPWLRAPCRPDNDADSYSTECAASRQRVSGPVQPLPQAQPSRRPPAVPHPGSTACHAAPQPRHPPSSPRPHPNTFPQSRFGAGTPPPSAWQTTPAAAPAVSAAGQRAVDGEPGGTRLWTIGVQTQPLCRLCRATL